MRRITNISQLPQKVQDRLAREGRMQAIRDKHKGKTPDQITNADVMEYMKEEMVQELVFVQR